MGERTSHNPVKRGDVGKIRKTKRKSKGTGNRRAAHAVVGPILVWTGMGEKWVECQIRMRTTNVHGNSCDVRSFCGRISRKIYVSGLSRPRQMATREHFHQHVRNCSLTTKKGPSKNPLAEKGPIRFAYEDGRKTPTSIAMRTTYVENLTYGKDQKQEIWIGPTTA